MGNQDKWNKYAQKFIGRLDNKLYIYDNWLDKFYKYIEKVETPIIDLGCGIGNDTLYLKSKNKEVISIDFSNEALQIVEKNIPGAITKQMDIEKEYSLEKASADLIIANISLHYFSEKSTILIIDKIKETLKKSGILIFRVNSVNDINHGSNSGEELEKHFYKYDEITKRFFDKEDIEYFFKDWQILYCKEKRVHMKIHQKSKVLWECVVKNV